MMTFEDKVCPTEAVKEQFNEDCREIFGGLAGRRVLLRLCQAVHPMQHTPGMSDHTHGNAEVVALLWRYGSCDLIPPQPEPTA